MDETVREQLGRLLKARFGTAPDIPDGIELFDRGVSKGDSPQLWIDVIAHIEMGRDKRQYRFVQDTRYGRTVLAESYEVPEIVQSVTRYVARRLVERERALSDDLELGRHAAQQALHSERRRRRWRTFRTLIYGMILGVAALFAYALYTGPTP